MVYYLATIMFSTMMSYSVLLTITHIFMWSIWIAIALYGCTNHNLQRRVCKKNQTREKKNLPLLNSIEVKKLRQRHIALAVLILGITALHVIAAVYLL